jgi:NitT/TauT family transport system permease protein
MQQTEVGPAESASRLGEERRDMAGLDRLYLPPARRSRTIRRVWSGLWPILVAVAVVLGVWQLVVMAELRPSYILPSPLVVLERLVQDFTTSELPAAIAITLRRAATGFGLALLIGTGLGLAILRWRLLRAAAASLITGLQTMPSIAWFPLAILIFGLTEQAILFVVILGAAPSVANGLISGVDHVPRILLRAGRVLGARGVDAYRFVVLPAAFPSFVGGMKQAWAFAWRSLMAGELLVIIAGQPSIGVRLQLSRELSDAPGLIAAMLVVLSIGIFVDLVVFGTLERRVREQWGLTEET